MDGAAIFAVTHTWFESVLQVGHQVVLKEDQLPVQVGDVQIGQRAQTLDHELLGLLLIDLSCQVTDVVLRERITYIHRNI